VIALTLENFCQATQRHVVRTFGGVHAEVEDDGELKEDPKEVRWRRKERESRKGEFPEQLFDGKWEDERSDIPTSQTRTSEFEGEEVLYTDTSADLEEMYPD
jgi:hypothetical protein